MWERSWFPPYHFSARCLDHNKDVLSWGFAKPVVIINLLLSIKWLERRSHGKSATWSLLGYAKKWERFWDVSFFILCIKMTGMTEAKHGMAEAVCFGRDVPGVCCWKCRWEKADPGSCTEQKVVPFQAKAFPIWTRQLVCASVQEFKSLYPLLQAMRLSEFGLQL